MYLHNMSFMAYCQLKKCHKRHFYSENQCMDFYERVKILAKTKAVTIESVANSAGLSIDSYNSYRRHNNLPRADEAVKIAQALGTTVEYLVTGKQPQQDHRETKELAAEILRLLSPYLGEQDL